MFNEKWPTELVPASFTRSPPPRYFPLFVIAGLNTPLTVWIFVPTFELCITMLPLNTGNSAFVRAWFFAPDFTPKLASEASDANAPGVQCGETAHKLGVSEIPSHSHPYSAYLYSTGAENGRINSQEGAGVKWADPANTRNSGGGDNHNNMQPSLYLHHIIKI